MFGRIKWYVVTLFALSLSFLLPVYAHAEGGIANQDIGARHSAPELEKVVCNINESGEKRIETWAIIMSQYLRVNEETVDCLSLLTIEEQAKAFELVLERLDLPEEPKVEKGDTVFVPSASPDAMFAPWPKEWVEYNVIQTSPHTASHTFYYTDGMCDDDPSDLDDIRFHLAFSSGMNTPWSMRTFARSTGPFPANVAAMLAYYQTQYGGVSAKGEYSNPVVQICLGHAGVVGAGGPWSIQMSMGLQR